MNNKSVSHPYENQRGNRMEKRLTFGGRFLMMREKSETDKEREES